MTIILIVDGIKYDYTNDIPSLQNMADDLHVEATSGVGATSTFTIDGKPVTVAVGQSVVCISINDCCYSCGSPRTKDGEKTTRVIDRVELPMNITLNSNDDWDKDFTLAYADGWCIKVGELGEKFHRGCRTVLS